MQTAIVTQSESARSFYRVNQVPAATITAPIPTRTDPLLQVPFVTVTDASISTTGGITTLTTATSTPFTASSIGQRVVVYGASAGSTNLDTTIATYTSTKSVTLAATTSTTRTTAHADIYNQDNGVLPIGEN